MIFAGLVKRKLNRKLSGNVRKNHPFVPQEGDISIYFRTNSFHFFWSFYDMLYTLEAT